MPAPPPPQQPVSFGQASPPFPTPPVEPYYPSSTYQQYSPPASPPPPPSAYQFKSALNYPSQPTSTEDQERANALWIQAHSGLPAANPPPVPGPPPLPNTAAFTPSMQSVSSLPPLPGRFVPTPSTSQQPALSLPGAFIPQPASAAYPPAPYAPMTSPATSYPPAPAAPLPPPVPSYPAAAQASSPASVSPFVPTPASPPLAAPSSNAPAWQAPRTAFPTGADLAARSTVGGSPIGMDRQAGNFSDDSEAPSFQPGDDARSSLSIPGRFQPPQQQQEPQTSGPFAPGPRSTPASLNQSAVGDSAPPSSDGDFSDAADKSAASGGVPQQRGGMSAAAAPTDDGSADRNLPAGPASRSSDSDNDYSDGGPPDMDSSSRPFSSSQQGGDASAPLQPSGRFQQQQQQASQDNGPFTPGPRSTSAPLDQPADRSSAPASSDDDLSDAANNSAPIDTPRQQRGMSAPAAPAYDDSADGYSNAQSASSDSDPDADFSDAGPSTRPFSSARAGTAGAAGMGGPATADPDRFDPPSSSDSDQAFNPRGASAAGSDPSHFDSAPRSAPRNGPSSQRAFSPDGDDSDVASNAAFNPRPASSAPIDSDDSDDVEYPPSRSVRNPPTPDVGADRFSPGTSGALGGGADPNAGNYAPDSDSDQQSDFGQSPAAYAPQRRDVGRPDSASNGGDSALRALSGDGYGGDDFAGDLGRDGDQPNRAQRAGTYAQDPDAHTDSSADETRTLLGTLALEQFGF